MNKHSEPQAEQDAESYAHREKVGQVTVAIDESLCVVLIVGGMRTTVTHVNVLVEALLNARDLRNNLELER